jgi:hypothetical protein
MVEAPFKKIKLLGIVVNELAAEFFAQFEIDDALGWYLNAVTTAWVPANASFAIPQPETAEAPQFYAISDAQSTGDALEKNIDQQVSILLPEIQSLHQVLGQISFGKGFHRIHGISGLALGVTPIITESRLGSRGSILKQ